MYRLIEMRWLKLAGALLLVVLLFTPSNALERKKQVGISGIIVSGFPSGQYSRLTNTGLGVGLELEYGVSNIATFEVIFNYLPFQGPDVVTDVVLNEEWRTMSYGAGGKLFFSPEKELVPYIRLSALFTDYDVDITRGEIKDENQNVIDPAIDTSFGENGKLTLSGGVGVRWDLNKKVGFSIELLYTQFFDAVHTLRGNEQRVDGQFVSFNLGASFFLGGGQTNREKSSNY
ncbi:MAG: porin family protein [candidate division Zixibacteria bacterium]|nr:porin family protein [candidate division Zixibacteria bacterium]